MPLCVPMPYELFYSSVCLPANPSDQGSVLQISLVDMLYRKSLRITAASKGKMGVGAIVNLQSNDASKLWGMAQYLHIIWSGPFQVLPLLHSVTLCQYVELCYDAAR